MVVEEEEDDDGSYLILSFIKKYISTVYTLLYTII